MLRQISGRYGHFIREFLALLRCHLAVQTDHTVGKGCERVLILCPKCHIQHQLLHADGRLALQRSRIRFL